MQKGVKKTVALLGIVAYLGVSMFLFASDANAQKSLQVSQSILPVRIAYVDGDGNIDRFWSNVSTFDNVYAIKFYRKNSTEEIVPSSYLIREFAEKYSAQENITPLCNDCNSRKQNRSVNVIVKSGNVVQEVETIV